MTPPNEPWAVFTDMDGTLLDHHDYNYEPAKPVLAALESRGIPVHIASSKTFAESLRYYIEWGVERPMVVENGAVVAIPVSQCDEDWGATIDGYRLRAITADYESIRQTLISLREANHWKVSGFGDWSAAEVAELTGLPESQAALSKQRQGTEPVLWNDSPEALTAFTAALEAKGLRLLRGGRFLHIMGQADKADGVATVLEHYRQRGEGSFKTLCLGDSDNDRTMLEQADCAIVVQKTDGSRLKLRRNQGLHYSNAPSPKGWADSVRSWLDS
ncbi:MAG: HAD-IIB family hydrolase [Gammaproteobacteria bacterium]